MSVFFIATRHARFAERKFPEGSTVIDPWRYIPDQKGVTVKRIGENRPELISILCPSRGRPKEFWRMVESAFEMATFPRHVEVIAYVDDDDSMEEGYLFLNAPAVDDVPWWFAQVGIGIGPRIVLSEMWNECYRAARGEILMHAGDDIVFRTPGWDEIVRRPFRNTPDKILLVHGDDMSPNTDALATHGFVHRRWVETLGYFVPPLFSSDWNDVWLTEVADALGRRLKVPIVTEHMHYQFGKAEHDETYREREERGDRDRVKEIYLRTAAERSEDAEKLRAVMACA